MKPLQKSILQRVGSDERNTNQTESNWKKEWKGLFQELSTFNSIHNIHWELWYRGLFFSFFFHVIHANMEFAVLFLCVSWGNMQTSSLINTEGLIEESFEPHICVLFFIRKSSNQKPLLQQYRRHLLFSAAKLIHWSCKDEMQNVLLDVW